MTASPTGRAPSWSRPPPPLKYEKHRIFVRCFSSASFLATQADKIDRIVTNRVLALPIFAAVMFLIYSIAMGTSPAGLFEGEEWGIAIGTMGTDWANDVLFGEMVPGLFDTILGTLGVAEGSWLYGLI